VGAEDGARAGRNLVHRFDEHGAAGAQVVDHVPVVDDLVQHVHGRAVEFERALDDVDGAHHAGAEAAGFGKDGVHGQGG
jgi:hypothetical protein